MAQLRTALVTGANRGLGRETCRQLAGKGYRVLLAFRSADGEKIARSLGGDMRAVRLDVADPGSIAALADRLRSENVQVDVLVNNAGIYESEPSHAREVLTVDFDGPRRVTAALLPFIPDGGNIVMVSSGMGELSDFPDRLRTRFLAEGQSSDDVAGLMAEYRDAAAAGRLGDAGWPSSPYVVAKAGLNALVRVLARELAPRKIRVNAVCPGWVRTDMGGAGAPRDVATGGASIVALAAPATGPTGGFFRDGRPIPW